MKEHKLLTGGTGIALGLLMAIGGCGCLVSGFQLRLETFGKLCLLWGLAACFCALAFSRKGGGKLVLGAGVAALGHLLHQERFWQQLWQLVYRISYVYNRAYGLGVFKLVDTSWDGGEADLPLCLLGMLLTVTTAWTVCRRKSCVYPVCLSLLPLSLCMVVTDTVPDTVWLYLLFLGMILLLLTNQTRKTAGVQGDCLAVLAALPAAVLLGLLLLLWMPQGTYVNYSGQLRDHVISWLRELPEEGPIQIQEPGTSQTVKEPEKVDLAALGSRRDSRLPVMEVTAETGGSLYLRGQDYDVYDGKGWTATANRVEELAFDGPRLGYVSVQTHGKQDHWYLPYYPRDGLSLIGGAYGNTRLAESYSFVRQGLPDNWREQAAELPPRDSGRGDRYLTIPQPLREKLAPMMAPVLAGRTQTWDKASAIASFVRDSAPYSKDTRRMPQEAEDFALWFLEEGEAGYCVHFATAATVLLRGAGIEARYVSGYMVSAQPGQTVTVTGEQAHAWAEYYEPALNTWVVLEATPAEGIPAPVETLPPQTEAPEETAAPSLPTQPEPETTAPPMVTETAPWVTEPPVQQEMEMESTGRLLPLLAAAGLLMLTELQRLLRLALERRGQSRGDRNRRCLRKWRRAERLAKHLKEEPPEVLEALAQKAKFSPHRLTEEELKPFDAYFTEGRGALEKSPWYKRLLYRYLFALY